MCRLCSPLPFGEKEDRETPDLESSNRYETNLWPRPSARDLAEERGFTDKDLE